MSQERPLRLVLFTSKHPRSIARFISRAGREVPGARVCGIVYQKPSPTDAVPTSNDLSLRTRLSRLAEELGSMALRFVHACPRRPNGSVNFRMEDLSCICNAMGCLVHITADLASRETHDFVRKLGPDLGIAYGPSGMNLALFHLPRLGSLILQKGRRLDCAGARPLNAEELRSGDDSMAIRVFDAKKTDDPGAALRTVNIPIEPLDSLVTLNLKANVIGNDLLLWAMAARAGKTIQDMSLSYQKDALSQRTTAAPAPHEPITISASSPYRPSRSRPIWNLVLRTMVTCPWVILRNWYFRLRGKAPVIILFHHMVSDRPHYNGIPTELFLKHVTFLRRHYRLATLTEAVEALQRKDVRAPMVVLTFDDGYQDNFLNMRAVAEECDFSAALFVASDHIAQGRRFKHDEMRQLDSFFPLTWEQLRIMQREGFEIGSHTRSHFDCGSADQVALEQEIAGSKTELEKQLNGPIRFFAFPWGHQENMSPPAVELALHTYSHFLSAQGGVNFPTQNDESRHLLRRSHENHIWELELLLQSVLDT